MDVMTPPTAKEVAAPGTEQAWSDSKNRFY